MPSINYHIKIVISMTTPKRGAFKVEAIGSESGSTRRRVGTGPAVRLRSGRTGQDRTKSSSGWTKPDFCRFFGGFLSVWRPKWTGRILPDFCRFFWRIFWRIFASLTPKMNRPDFNRTGPDRMEKTRPVPTLTRRVLVQTHNVHSIVGNFII